jgi:hypothetical protein
LSRSGASHGQHSPHLARLLPSRHEYGLS